MDEREKNILKNIAEALPKMSEFNKGYILGLVESEENKTVNAVKS